MRVSAAAEPAPDSGTGGTAVPSAPLRVFPAVNRSGGRGAGETACPGLRLHRRGRKLPEHSGPGQKILLFWAESGEKPSPAAPRHLFRLRRGRNNDGGTCLPETAGLTKPADFVKTLSNNRKCLCQAPPGGLGGVGLTAKKFPFNRLRNSFSGSKRKYVNRLTYL